MRRSRRIALTLAAATGLLGGAGAAVAGIDSPTAGAGVSPPASSTTLPTVTTAVDTDTELAAYVDGMARREARLEERVAAARARFEDARAVHASQVAAALQARASAAASTADDDGSEDVADVADVADDDGSQDDAAVPGGQQAEDDSDDDGSQDDADDSTDDDGSQDDGSEDDGDD